MAALALNGRSATSLAWQQAAACRGPEAAWFYPPLHHERKAVKASREQRAKAVCAGCDVRAECLDHALDTQERFGVWGGTTESERAVLLTRRDIASPLRAVS